MNHLLRDRAPITAETWDMIDEEAKERLSVALGARRLVDFEGPLGWKHSATSLGRVGEVLDTPADGVIAQQRRVLPLAEVRADFTMPRSELEAATRGAVDVDFTALDQAAERIAETENSAVFDGWQALGMTGIAEASPYEPVALGDDPRELVERVAAALAELKSNGIGGPYGLALTHDAWINTVGGNDVGGQPLITHLERILEGPVQWVPGINSSVVLSLRGGDFMLEVGQDLAVGYWSHDSESVQLYLQETFNFRVATPEAAIRLA